MSPTDPAIARKINILRGMGLGGMIPPQPLQVSPHQPTIDTGDIVSKLSLTAMTMEPLKYKKDSLPPPTQNESLEPDRRRKHIQFNDDVSVVPIPMRSEYSERVRARLWSDRYEIHDMASRNALEFAAEGWDWKNVIEDDGMYVCTSSGELIHPVHCQR